MELREEVWVRPSQGLDVEIIQAQEEGRQVGWLEDEVARVLEMEQGRQREFEAEKLYTRVQNAPMREGYAYTEPDNWDDVMAECLDMSARNFDATRLKQAISGGWNGRIAGCMLGAPVETWKKDRIQGFLKETGNWPPEDYLSSDVSPEILEKYMIKNGPGFYGNDNFPWKNLFKGYAQEDDDINYSVMALLAMEKHGLELTTDRVGKLWLDTLPVMLTCTAERVAYRNLCNAIYPPETAVFYNPYREWIGAQIRTDVYGYVFPGQPLQAARFAYIDASLSHTKNGVYGAMWVAALASLAFSCKNTEELVSASLGCIPKASRLYEELLFVLSQYRKGIEEPQMFSLIHEKYDEHKEHFWCHTIPNAMVVAAALLYGGLDFTKSIGLGIMYGFDTDCNAATIGSVTGLMIGAENIPRNWTECFMDSVKTGLHNHPQFTITGLVDRTAALAEQFSLN